MASCSSLTALIPLAVQAVRIAFRMGARVTTVGNQLESTVDRSQTWSTIVLGIGSEAAQIALEDFNDEQVCNASHALIITC